MPDAMQDQTSAFDEALDSGLPIAHAGPVDGLFAAATGLGMRLARIDASAVASLDDAAPWDSRSAAHWLIVVEGCEHAASTAGLPDDAPRQGEDLLLDLAFDGHPSLPAARTVVLAFGTPTDLSEALADDACPCAFTWADAPAAAHEEPLRLAA